MRNIRHLEKQVNDFLAKIEEEQRRRNERAIVFYDPATGLPLPGYEPSPSSLYILLLPHNGRDDRKVF
jgi:hypothetical protein